MENPKTLIEIHASLKKGPTKLQKFMDLPSKTRLPPKEGFMTTQSGGLEQEEPDMGVLWSRMSRKQERSGRER